jgi:twitching motility protein PilT
MTVDHTGRHSTSGNDIEPAIVADVEHSSVGALLQQLWDARGTDLQLTPGAPPQIRVHGALVPVKGAAVLMPSDTAAMLGQLLTEPQLDDFAAGREFDFSFGFRDLARIRGNAFHAQGNIAIALRIIPAEIPTMEQLNLPPVLGEFVTRHQGLVLVTGPTGSGKSTTLAAMINQINHDRACHIITVEDPIEYVHHHKRSIVNQREVGTDTASFPHALRSALREDPDVLLVGEMRDLESIRFALTIAETGHLVFATLHTNDTAQALARMIDVFPGDQQDQIRVQLAAALTGIIYQRLIPKIGGGLVAAYEVLVANTAIRNLIKEGKPHMIRNNLVTGAKEGMVTFENSLNTLVADGTISFEDAQARSLYPKELTQPRPVAPASAGVAPTIANEAQPRSPALVPAGRL